MKSEEAIGRIQEHIRIHSKKELFTPYLDEAFIMAIEALKTHDELCENLAWYINERQRLLKVIEYSKPNEGLQRTIRKALKRPHGKWTEEFDESANPFFQRRWRCSACNDYNCYGRPDFCPCCGADMRPKEGEEGEV